ncbi:hypothetical protein EXU57_09150 [Segetibacter sp. 3557_3]|uniref:hypothetical protein n=1 Tax=Segetibacter sp. 3557_3 TaxID=2547429 RepID=UPI001058FD7E|nr:hypothetical protein [Segetibacter sp. 3557_3]TDH26960.1 hypothetical protein EXU57_09150 [Segetibacter sp. 3557_3]
MYFRKTLRNLCLVLTLASAFTACRKDTADQQLDGHEDPTREYKYLRLLVSDEVSNKINLVEPFSGKITAFDAKYPLSSLYGTASGRFAAVLYQNQNLVEVFDGGLQSHVDHIDVIREPGWSNITANGLKPSHFKSKGVESLIFNDNDGTLSVGNESDFNKPGAKFSVINAGLFPHHGAMTQFNNGTYAVTIAPSAGASPNRVQVINQSGSVVHASTLETGAIHGNASDGNVAVFGGFTSSAATEGAVLVVKASGEQRLIPNPAGFGAFRLANIYYAGSAKKFIGYVATKGAYLVDVEADKITPIYTGSDAFQCKVDYAGKNLLLLTLDGKLRIYNLSTGALTKEGNVITAVASSDTYKPVLEATARYAYIAMPASGEVHQVSLQDFNNITKHKVSSRPVRLTLFGFESSADH